MPDQIDMMSTRLFPKGQGADQYGVTGIAARCDWVVLSDYATPKVHLIDHERSQPRTVFLSLRSCFDALEFFCTKVLPTIQQPFVLISGSEDTSVPTQTDQRWRPFNARERGWISSLLADSRLIHWFAENLAAPHPKMSPLPLGILPCTDGTMAPVQVPRVKPLQERQKGMLCAHRVRDGIQWNERRDVTAMCKAHGGSICTVVDEDVPEKVFFQYLEDHRFVLCARGGGLDPSPKAWLAMLHGAIPIIRSSPLDAAYRLLPVVIVQEWSPELLDDKQLQDWQMQLQFPYNDLKGRHLLLNKLSLDFWWVRILVAYRRRSPGYTG